jgi:hypothetical protein
VRCTPRLKLEYNVQGVDNTLDDASVLGQRQQVSATYRNVTENSQQDVDEEVCVAAALQEDTQRREDDSEDDLAEVTVSC